jgi:hypothetical protein
MQTFCRLFYVVAASGVSLAGAKLGKQPEWFKQTPEQLNALHPHGPRRPGVHGSVSSANADCVPSRRRKCNPHVDDAAAYERLFGKSGLDKIKRIDSKSRSVAKVAEKPPKMPSWFNEDSKLGVGMKLISQPHRFHYKSHFTKVHRHGGKDGKEESKRKKRKESNFLKMRGFDANGKEVVYKPPRRGHRKHPHHLKVEFKHHSKDWLDRNALAAYESKEKVGRSDTTATSHKAPILLSTVASTLLAFFGGLGASLIILICSASKENAKYKEIPSTKNEDEGTAI